MKKIPHNTESILPIVIFSQILENRIRDEVCYGKHETLMLKYR